MQTFQKSLYQILVENNEQFYCPPIQREYVWDKKKREELLADLYALTQGEENHFFGTLILSSPEEAEIEIEGETERYRRRMVIDGQQRLTSLYLFLFAAHRRLNELTAKSLDKVKKHIGNCVRTDCDALPKLMPTFSDWPELEAVLKGEVSTKREIGRAAAQFKLLMDELNPVDELRPLIDAALHRTTFVVVELSKGEDPCAYFAAANGRGIPLNPTDLIKNLLLMKSGEKDLEAASRQYWEPLESALGSARLRHLTLAVHDVAHGWEPRSLVYRNLGEDLRKQGASAFFKEMSLWKDAYCWLDKRIFLTESLPRRAADSALRTARVKRFLPEGVQFMWMFPVTHYLQRHLSAQELGICLDLVENYAVRMFGNFGSTLRDVSARLSNLRSRNLAGEAFVKGFGKALHGHQAYSDRSDAELRRFVSSMRVRKGADEQWAIACLLGLEAALRPASTPVQPSLEHILPKKWVSAPVWSKVFDRVDDGDIQFRLGNLTILGLADNCDLGRASFNEKKEFMQRSPLLLNERIAALNTWDKAAILDRTDYLVEKICELWPHHKE